MEFHENYVRREYWEATHPLKRMPRRSDNTEDGSYYINLEKYADRAPLNFHLDKDSGIDMAAVQRAIGI